jgi:hypothetical protein
VAAADMVASVATVDVVVRDLSADDVELVLEPQPGANNATGTTASRPRFGIRGSLLGIRRARLRTRRARLGTCRSLGWGLLRSRTSTGPGWGSPRRMCRSRRARCHPGRIRRLRQGNVRRTRAIQRPGRVCCRSGSTPPPAGGGIAVGAVFSLPTHRLGVAGLLVIDQRGLRFEFDGAAPTATRCGCFEISVQIVAGVCSVIG